MAGAPGLFLGGAARDADALSTYEVASGGRVGVFAQNVATGTAIAWRADERFVMCSTFKLSLAAAVLARADLGAERLGASIAYTAADVPDWFAPVARANLARGTMTVAEMCAAAVGRSDNTCANLLLARIGGPPAMTAFWRRCGDTVSRLDDTEPVLNRTPPGGVRDTTTPRAMARTVRRLVVGDVLTRASRDLLRGWLVGAVTGFDRLRAGLPHDWRVGDKTGNNGHDAAGDLAVAWTPAGSPIVVAAYTHGGTPTPLQLRTLFAAIGGTVGRRLA